MHKENPVQLEIFSLGGAGVKTQEKNTAPSSYIWNYERAILITIAFLVVSVASFSLGYERGKKTLSFKPTAASDITTQETALPQNIKVAPVKEKVIKNIENKEPLATTYATTKSIPTTKIYPGSYTIQVATYKFKGSAQKENQLLKNKGYQPLIFSKGDYVQLCVGKFLTKDEAQVSLRELKKRYQDCFIRRL